ncbi:hypothetical protein HD599_002157 [Conyzicola lurida]|uniref:Lytic transglycosylase domain-containing protein n=1 Tax=Conyzicola lurida TaxID=1172621 RepID=A0A841AND1_9MICO|nr:hypothetical protein [Conyzicola lurida]
MDIQRRDFDVSVQPVGARNATRRTSTRSRKPLPFLAFAATMSFVLVAITDPTAAFAMTAQTDDQITIAPVEEVETQSVVAVGVDSTVARDAFEVIKYVPPVVVAPASSGAPAAGTPDPGSAQAIAHSMVLSRGWGESEYNCLVSLWKKESGWNVYAHNKGSGAYGIPQALPGSKMASAGADWATNAATQITWGLGYISGRYGTPCGAWGTSQAKGWY